jgi:hypothetical protein
MSASTAATYIFTAPTCTTAIITLLHCVSTQNLKPLGFHNFGQLKITCASTDDHPSMHWIPSIFFFNNMGIKREE